MTLLRRLAACLVAAAALVPAWPAVSGDAPGLVERRSVSCAGEAFETVRDHGAAVAYRSKHMGLNGDVHVGGAVLEWCQAAQNAAIYFYVDDPAGPQHEVCPESMSLAVFPGQGAQTRKIIEDNKPSYFNPMVTLIEPPVISAVPVKSGGRTIDTVQLEAVVVDQTGHNRRQKMIGYARGADFVRVMTGALDDPKCANAASKSFMAKLAWP